MGQQRWVSLLRGNSANLRRASQITAKPSSARQEGRRGLVGAVTMQGDNKMRNDDSVIYKTKWARTRRPVGNAENPSNGDNIVVNW